MNKILNNFYSQREKNVRSGSVAANYLRFFNSSQTNRSVSTNATYLQKTSKIYQFSVNVDYVL